MVTLAAAGEATTGIDWVQRADQPIDPYLIWADWCGFAGATPAAEASGEGADGQELQLRVAFELTPGALAALQAQGIAAQECVASDSACYATATVSVAQLSGLLDHPDVHFLEFGFAKRAARPRQAPAISDAPRRLQGPVMAVIDNGCAFAHEHFREQVDGVWRSRIAYLWDQDDCSQPPAAPWRAVQGQRYGRELSGLEIDAALDRWQVAGRIQEDALYQAVDYDKVMLTRTHGTHVLDLAAGERREHGELDGEPAPAPHIIFVQLPGFAVDDTSGASLVTHVLDALRYILDRVEPGEPLVINLSYGSMAGPHDGSSLIEKAMDATLRPVRANGPLSERAIVLPAGNNFEADGHALVRLSAGQLSRTLLWQVQSDDPTDTFAELWYPRAAAGQLRLTVTPPQGPALSADIGQSRVLLANGTGSRPLCALIHRRHVSSGRDDAMALIALAPCQARDDGVAAPAGIWTITLTWVGREGAAPPASKPLEVHLWVERDDPVVGSGAPPQQARFLSEYPPLDRNADSLPGDLVQRSFTGNSIAHGSYTTVVGACQAAELECSRYSSSGPSRNPHRQQWPDFVEVADASASLSGVLAAGTRSGSWVRMNGTSVAAPQVARRLLNAFVAAGDGRVTRPVLMPLPGVPRLRQGRGRLR